MIRSIPVTYAGIRFRSTLEARWAATFDQLGWYWEYEPTAVDLGHAVRYLCDFHLPAQSTWVEVKGPTNDRIAKTHQLRRTAPARDLIIIARPAGPQWAANFHTPNGYHGVTIQRCSICNEWCFHDYQHSRNAGDSGWTCRICGVPDALARIDSYLPAWTRESLLRTRGSSYIDAFWPTTKGLLPLASIHAGAIWSA